MKKNRAFVITEPQTDQHWQDYYQLRWLLLRKPWHQVQGTEKDSLESVAYHRMALDNGKVIAVARIHIVGSDMAQIRYMAVHADYQGQQIGALLLDKLEQVVQKQGVKKVILNSRESACGFYLKGGYTVVAPSYVLYGLIPHFLMEKWL
ncbi:MAG TPA: GNAT family N-acetyltransferase [Gammaproteobacteria bacterium]|nr:GNAT family N-acetyltransferase [Gammaproteobacteria bacterium]